MEEPTVTNLEGLGKWWAEKSDTLAGAAVPKMIEYGSDDLTQIGSELLDIAGVHEYSKRQAYEAGVFFYVRGKVSRWSYSVKQQAFVSDDTLHDIITYCMMVLDRRENGAR